MALQISRKYDFKPGTKIYSAQMDEELNQLVEAHNSVVTDKADKTGVLEKTNTEVFTPTENYQPATKKYVDESIGAVVLGQLPDGSVTKAKLSETVQASINKADGSVQQTDKATQDEADAGIEDSHFMTPSKVMKVVKDHDYQVGDVKVTRRTNLGDDWLLCNGEQFDHIAYPDLKAISSQVTALDKVTPAADGFQVSYVNGYWVAYRHLTTTGSTIQFWVTQNPKQELSKWQLVTIASTYTNYNICDVCYGNGYYLIAVVGYSTYSGAGNSFPVVYYGTDLLGTLGTATPGGTSFTNITCTDLSISYANGKYFLIELGNGGRMWRATSPASSWTLYTMKDTQNSNYTFQSTYAASKVHFFKNYYVFFVTAYYYSSVDRTYVYEFYSTDGVNWSSFYASQSSAIYPSDSFVYGDKLYAFGVGSANAPHSILVCTTPGAYSVTLGYTAGSHNLLNIFKTATLWGCITYDADAGSTARLSLYPTITDLIANTNRIYTDANCANPVVLKAAGMHVSHCIVETDGGVLVCSLYGTTVSSGPVPALLAPRIFEEPLGYRVPTLTTNTTYNYIRGKMS